MSDNRSNIEVLESLKRRSARKYSSAGIARPRSGRDAVRRRESKGGGDGAYGVAASIEEVATAAALGLGPGGVVQVHHVATGASFDVFQRHRIMTIVPCALRVAAAA